MQVATINITKGLEKYVAGTGKYYIDYSMIPKSIAKRLIAAVGGGVMPIDITSSGVSADLYNAICKEFGLPRRGYSQSAGTIHLESVDAETYEKILAANLLITSASCIYYSRRGRVYGSGVRLPTIMVEDFVKGSSVQGYPDRVHAATRLIETGGSIPITIELLYNQ